jgi:hypothetical protein
MWHEEEKVPVATFTELRLIVFSVHVSCSAILSPVFTVIPAILEGVMVATAPGLQLEVVPVTVLVTAAPETAVEAAVPSVKVVPEMPVMNADRFPPDTPAPATKTESPTMNPPTEATFMIVGVERLIVPVVSAQVHITALIPEVS